MILNEHYYRTLWEKFEGIRTLNEFDNNASCLSTKLILEHFKKNKPIHINFQSAKNLLFETGKQLFIELANDIYLNHYDLPNLTIGCRLRDKRKYSDGKKHDYVLKRISKGSYDLESLKGTSKVQISPNYDKLVKNFIPIEKGSRQLKGYSDYFTKLNDGLKLEFTPTCFEKTVIFIASKSFWDSLPNKNKIPCSYLPNSREENHISEINSIPALHDSLAYFTPKYEICYQQLLLKGKKVKTIVVFDTETDKIEQILQDKVRFDFNVIIVSNSFSPTINEAIPCWNWFKEEIKIVNAI